MEGKSRVEPAARPSPQVHPQHSGRLDRAAASADSFIAAAGSERSMGRPGPSPSLLDSCLDGEKSWEEMAGGAAGESLPESSYGKSATLEEVSAWPSCSAEEGWQEKLPR